MIFRGITRTLIILVAGFQTAAYGCDEDVFRRGPGRWATRTASDGLPLIEMFEQSARLLAPVSLARSPSFPPDQLSSPGEVYLPPKIVERDVRDALGPDAPYSIWLRAIAETELRIRFSYRPIRTLNENIPFGIMVVPHRRPDFRPVMLTPETILLHGSVRPDSEIVERQLQVNEFVLVRNHDLAHFEDPTDRANWGTPARRAQTLKTLLRLTLSQRTQLPIETLNLELDRWFPTGVQTVGTYLGRHSDGRAIVRTRIPFSAAPTRFNGQRMIQLNAFEATILIPREALESVAAHRFSVLKAQGASARLRHFDRTRARVDLSRMYTSFPIRGPLTAGPLMPRTGQRFEIESLDGNVTLSRSQLLATWNDRPRRVELPAGNPFAEIRSEDPVVHALQRQAMKLVASPELFHAPLEQQLRVLSLWNSRLFLRTNPLLVGVWAEGTPSILESLATGEANPIQKAAFLGAILELLGARVTIEYVTASPPSLIAPVRTAWLRLELNGEEYWVETDPRPGAEPTAISRANLERSMNEGTEERPEYQFLRTGLQSIEFVEVRD